MFEARKHPNGPARSGRPALSRERMIETALELVDESGAGDFSLRALAERLNSGTATLYRHFSGKQQILDLVVDRVLAEVTVELDSTAVPADTPWPEHVRRYTTAFFDVLQRHPRAAPLFSGATPNGPAGRAARERWLHTLVTAGLPAARAARIYTTLARFVVGFAVQLEAEAHAASDHRADSSPPRPDALLEAPGEGLDAESSSPQFPATAAAAAHLSVPLREEFEFGLDLLISGLTGINPTPRTTLVIGSEGKR